MVVNIFIELQESRLSKCHFTRRSDWFIRAPDQSGFVQSYFRLWGEKESWPSDLKHFTCSRQTNASICESGVFLSFSSRYENHKVKSNTGLRAN